MFYPCKIHIFSIKLILYTMSIREHMSQNWLNWISRAVLAIIPALIIYYIGVRDTRAAAINNKADKTWVNSKLSERDRLVITPMQKDIEELKQTDKDTRAEFLEEIRLLRQDIMNLYNQKK